jgi:hypothetical protein
VGGGGAVRIRSSLLQPDLQDRVPREAVRSAIAGGANGIGMRL